MRKSTARTIFTSFRSVEVRAILSLGFLPIKPAPMSVVTLKQGSAEHNITARHNIAARPSAESHLSREEPETAAGAVF